jgi:hypothetical protein
LIEDEQEQRQGAEAGPAAELLAVTRRRRGRRGSIGRAAGRQQLAQEDVVVLIVFGVAGELMRVVGGVP